MTGHPFGKSAGGWIGRALIAIAGLLLLSSMAQTRVPTVLFICQAGTVKSAIARELMRRSAIARGVRVRVFSRGIAPEQHLSPQLKERLESEGIYPERQPLTRLRPSDIHRADVVVYFDRPPLPIHARRVYDWTDIGSFNDAYAVEGPRVEQRIDRLLDELGDKDGAHLK